VYTDVDTGNNMNMIACVRAANKHSLSAYVSVHCDWHKAPTGTLPLYNSASGKLLASKLNEGVRSQVTIATRGLSKRSDLYELNMSDAVACIFETGSIKYDSTLFKQKSTLYGMGLAKGLCNYLGVPFFQ
jgi:N-acetylmuramoyl-L-alanine amidase